MEIVLPTVSSNVPAFLAKLWKMVDDPSTDHLIDWSEEGNSFIIHNQADFAQRLLPTTTSTPTWPPSSGSSTCTASTRTQVRARRPNGGHLLDQIKRKISTGKNSGGSQAQSFSTTYAPNVKSEHVTEVLNEVSLIKDKQDEMDGKLDSMKKENEALWREVVTLRQKHQSQQKIVNKLIQFLVSLVQPRVGAGSSSAVKRRFNTLPLALEGEHAPKESRLEDSGPIIKDVTHVPSPEFIEEAPFSPMQAVDPSLVSGTMPAAFAKEVVAAASEVPTRPLLTREISKEDIDLDMNNMQRDLDNLKDILSGQVTLDTSIISNIFNPEEPLYSF
ncbi:Heat shock factor proteinlike, partial [Caligus rogercresseyi]